MLFEHLLILSTNLPYRVILTRLFKHLKIDLSGKKAIAPFVNINSTLIKRMQASTRAHAPSPLVQPQAPFVSGSSSSVDPYDVLMTQIDDLSLNIISATETILANQNEFRQEYQNECHTSAHPFVTSRDATMLVSPGMIRLLLFLMDTLNIFMLRVLLLIRGVSLPDASEVYHTEVDPPLDPYFQSYLSFIDDEYA